MALEKKEKNSKKPLDKSLKTCYNNNRQGDDRNEVLESEKQDKRRAHAPCSALPNKKSFKNPLTNN